MDVPRAVDAAEARIRPHIRETPVEPSPLLSRETGARVWLKLECYQRSGSFKIRGALNKVLSLTEDERRRGVVAASSGNHGMAIAELHQSLGVPALVVVPEDASPTKVEAIRSSGAEVEVRGDDCVVAEAWARREAARRGATYISPYNDPVVIGGQGTLGVELARQLDGLDTLYLAVGGGGLIAGVAGWLKRRWPELEVVGCSPRRSAVLAASLDAGQILELESSPTLSDGTAGGLEPGAITFELCQRSIDRFVLVDEDEIAAAMRWLVGHHHILVEGAAGAALAGLHRDASNPERRSALAGRRLGVVLCGANVSLEVLRQILD